MGKRVVRRRFIAVAAVALAVAGALVLPDAEANHEGAPDHASASGFLTYKYPIGQPGCSGVGINTAPSFAFSRDDCGFAVFQLSPAPETAEAGVARLFRPGTEEVFAEVPVEWDAMNEEAQFFITPEATWPAGEIRYQVFATGETVPAGGSLFRVNFIGADISVPEKPGGAAYAPGEDIPVAGDLYELDITGTSEEKTNVPATYSLRVSSGNGTQTFGPFTAGSGAGNIDATIPASATAGLVGRPENNFRTGITIEVIDAAYEDPSTGAWAAETAGSFPFSLQSAPDALVLENSFVSPTGWVRPGDTYAFRVFVKNFLATPAIGAVVTIPPVDGTTFTQARPAAGAGTATIGSDGAIRWTVGALDAAGDAGPATKTLVAEARADTTTEDPRIVWKNLSSTATLTYTGGPAGLTSTSLGPKVVPPSEAYASARYGYRPFPVVPVDYTDRKHAPSHVGDRLANVINSPDFEGSTYNLYQEMSLGQLSPNGTVPSAGIDTAGFEYEPGFDFTDLAPGGTCRGGVTVGDAAGTPLYPERISGGWYQLPGNTDYYGDDEIFSEGYSGQAGVRLGDIDSGCGPTAKAVYDAAAIADPELDYSDYDTDKDGVVDFFMMVFVGTGGNGASQFEVPPYDNIWPHSSSLEFTYTSDEGNGYVSDDQLKDVEGNPIFWTDESRTATTKQTTEFPVYVRVGPYNVNPETAIDHASVISHEYGHSLGLPDFYSISATRQTYGDWTLMAQDKSQNMDIFAKQELGWIVPRVLQPGETVVEGWRDSKVNTHRIDWVTPDGTPYRLEGPTVNNAEAYVAKLPSGKVLDAAKVEEGASPPNVWWSGAGDNFGCPPASTGHSFDVYLPELADVPDGTPVTVTFQSLWDIEWDFDYGFVMYSTDKGKTYTSMASEENYTTPATQNPQDSACLAEYGNGLTGSSGSYAAGTQEIDRTGVGDTTGLAPSYPEAEFLTDSYDLSDAAGEDTVLRFAYYSDSGTSRPGWFIDNLKITAGDQVIYESDFETENDQRLYPGGCRESNKVAVTCTRPWQRVNASAGAFDHAYYLEMRDRSGFDFDGHDQAEAGPIGFAPGALLVYTDESHGYGNVGVGDPPAQSPLDSQPQEGEPAPNLDDAAFTASAGDNRFSDSGEGHVDNYSDPRREDQLWRFDANCLTFDVLAMQGAGEGPAGGPGDLRGDVRFTRGPGCAEFDYGYLGASTQAPPPPPPPAPAPAPAARQAGLPATGGDVGHTGLLLGLALCALLYRRLA